MFGLLDTTVQNSVHIPSQFQNIIMNLLKPNFKGGKKLPKFITSKIFEQKQNMNMGLDLSVPYNFGKVWRNMISLGYNVYFIFS